jgi:polyisoprenoid-binding protein YceI
MKNTYIVISVVIVVAVLAFVFGSKKPAIVKVDDVALSPGVDTALTDGSYNIDASKSYIRWSADYTNGAMEEGEILPTTGFVAVVSGSPALGEFNIDMSTIKPDSNIVLENYMKAEGVLNIDRYPYSRFTVTRVLPNPTVSTTTGKYIVDGRLTIKDVTQAISFPITVSENGTRLTADSAFAINMAEWGVKSPVGVNLKEIISVKLHIEAVR